MEAAHILQYTEDEFLQTLDWRPHAKADFHICKSKQKEHSEELKCVPKIEESETEKQDIDDESNVNVTVGGKEDLDHQEMNDNQTLEFNSEETTNGS